jgi:hypothetical protein
MTLAFTGLSMTNDASMLDGSVSTLSELLGGNRCVQ